MRVIDHLCVMLASLSSVAGQPNPQSGPVAHPELKIALLIAVDQYQTPELSRISFGVQHARQIGRLLEEQDYVIYSLLGSSATRAGILDVLSEIENRTKSQPAQIVVFFSGYSVQQSGKSYFASYDTQPSRPEETAVGISSLAAQLLRPNGNRVIAWIDASTSDLKQSSQSVNAQILRIFSQSSAAAALSATVARPVDTPEWINNLSGPLWTTRPLKQDKIFFKFNDSKLSPESKMKLDEFAKSAEDWGDYRISVEGYLGGVGAEGANALYAKRSNEVTKYLVNQHHIPVRSLAVGLAATPPTMDGNTRPGRATNREIALTLYVPPGGSGKPGTISDSLERGLSGQAAREDGTIRLSDLASFVSSRVKPETGGEFAYSRTASVSAAPYDPVISRHPGYAEVELYYATDRARTKVTAQGQEYGSDRSATAALDLGKCRVSIPGDHRLGSLETVSIVSIRRGPDHNVELLHTTPATDSQTFWRDFAQSLQKAPGKQILIFVHGFRTSFESAVRRTAQLTYDLQFPGPAIAYTWPADETPVLSYFRYSVQETNVDWTTQHLQNLLNTTFEQFADAQVHVVAHSLGNRAVVNAVRDLPPQARIAQLVLAAPDIDAGIFKQIAAAVRARSGRTTLYANSSDEALWLSSGLHGFPRAGQSGPDLVVVNGIDTIDASKIDTGLLGHSYYGDRRSVVADLYNLIRLGLEPGRRFGLQSVKDARGNYWLFNP